MNLNKLPPGELTDTLVTMKRVFLVVGAFSFALNLLLLVPALYMLQTYDRVLTSRNEGTLLALTMLLAALLALEAAMEFVRSRILSRAAAAIDLKMDARIFDAMFTRALYGHGEHQRALGDMGQVRQFLNGKGLLAFFDAPWLPIYLFVVFLLSPWLGLFALIAALVLIAMAWYNEKVTGELHSLSGMLGNRANQEASASLRNAEAVGAMGMLTAMRGRWQAKQHAYLAALGEANDLGAKVGGAVRFFRMLFQSAILGLGAYLVLQNQLTAGAMVASSILLGRALAPVDLAISNWRGVVAARNSFERLNRLLAEVPSVTHLVTLPRPRGVISVENLYVAAPGKKEPILRGLNFQIAEGKLIAIVGPSASGKSTLARALVGVWTPLSGAVRLDGADIGTWDRDELGPNIGYLPQDVELFDGSVAENIARFSTLDSERIVEAAQRAGFHDAILRLPQGYDTIIGESGIALSGGQRQRLALARALYNDPVVIVLDEPNANLDDAGDAALLQALKALKDRQRTVFVVTHRMNLLAETDAVMVMAEGKIQAFGPSADLIRPARPGTSGLPAPASPLETAGGTL